MATEKLKFEIHLYSEMWDKAPSVKISIGDETYFTGEIKATKDKPEVIIFEHACEENENYELIIHRSNKIKGQTIVNDKGDIIKDQMLFIESIIIDEIDIGTLVYEGEYKPEYPEPWATQQRTAGSELPEKFKNVTQMGHNGTWTFKFASPFYMWLLENLY